MQTFRAYTQDAAGAITWASWIDAEHRDDARGKAQALRPGQALTLELWSATDRRPHASCQLDPV
jgi:hypothetical protein